GTYTETITWRAVDACGNQSGTVAQAITVIDNTPPTIGSPGANGTVACPATPSFTPPTASDACSGATVQQVGGDVTGGTACAKTITRTWHAVDGCGNTSGTVSQTISIIDNTPPVIGTVSSATVECTATPSFTPPTASDACSGATVQQVGGDVTGGTACAKTITRTWHAVDGCGNTSGTVSQTISIIDNTPPVIGTESSTTGECTATPPFTRSTASDACSGATVQQVGGDVTGGTACAKTITRTWHAVDACGDSSGTISPTNSIIHNTQEVIR